MANRRIDVKEERAAHRRRLAAPRRAARSNDPESVALRNHRAAHWHNLTHEELREKRPVPGRVPWQNQMPLCMGEGEEDDTA